MKNPIRGELSLAKDGYGFVMPENASLKDIFIPARFIGNALGGDIVEAEISHHGDRPDGIIKKIVKRGKKHLVGRFVQKGKQFIVEPEDERIKHLVLIPHDKTNGAKSGETVVVDIISYPGDKKGFLGVVNKRFGQRGTDKVELALISAKYGLKEKFPKNVLDESAKLYKQYTEENGLPHKDRTDLSKIPFVTIDGETARDFDDAISVEKIPKGLRLYVSIADVSFYVREGSAIDREAYSRATSVYFPQRCLPMLPHELSDDLCSLRPNEPKLTVTAVIDFSKDGKILKTKFLRSKIVSRARLTYTEVKKILVDRDELLLKKYRSVAPMLKLAEELHYILNENRMKRGSVDFDLPEPEIILDIEGGPDAIVKAERNIAHRLIEDFMIAANEAVAEFLTSKKKGCLYRVHDKPDPAKIAKLRELLHNFGLNSNAPLFKVPALVRNTPEERLVNSMLLRSMAQAVYSERNSGHFGLASKCYCHFTSPIRRYPDLVVHRLLCGKKASSARLSETALNSSRCERTAMEAERETVALYRALFMRDHIGEIYKGIISHITKSGFFVELTDYFVEGFVDLDSMPRDNYSIKQHEIYAKKAKKAYRIGDPIKVEVADVSIERRAILFQPIFQ